MIIQTIYDTYNIPAHLQLHMLRVAAIVQNICQEWKTQNMDVQQLITVALLHDLGNIVKFNMTLYPTVWEPEGLNYRIKVKEKMRKYGDTEYQVTHAIATEIGINKETLDLLYQFDFLHSGEKLDTGNIALYLLDYADARVAPHGIVSIKERTDDFVKRNMKNKNRTFEEARTISDKRYAVVFKMEAEIFSRTNITPSHIIHEELSSQLDNLRQFNIITQ